MPETIFPEVAPPTYTTAQTPVTAPVLQFDDWKLTEAEDVLDDNDQLKHYFDYFRIEKFKRGELDAQTEADIRQVYFEETNTQPDLSEAERSQIGLRSTAYAPSFDQKLELVKGGFGEKEIQPFTELPEADQESRFSNAKELLVRRGQLSFASLNKEGKSFVQAGNYDKLTPDNLEFATQEALSAISSGALSPTDLWQVSQGLSRAGVGGRSLFQNELDQDVLGKLQEILTEETKSSELLKPLTDAIDDVITTKDEKSFFSQVFDDDPTSVNEVIVDEEPVGIRDIQDELLKLFNEETGIETKPSWALSDSDRYTRDRVITLVQELAVRHANESNEFSYTEDTKNLSSNIRRSKLGVPMAAPRLMMNSGNFIKALNQHTGISDVERDLLKRQRDFYMLSRA